jgi:large conductance mechanosensitive channel protein
LKKFFGDFKAFALKGNVMDLAIGVIIGAAFKSIVDSLVGDIISPVLSLFATAELSELSFKIGEAEVRYGTFLTAVINFLIMALVIFLFVKLMSKLKTKNEEQESVTTKNCPHCKRDIPIEATRCPECTSDLAEKAL